MQIDRRTLIASLLALPIANANIPAFATPPTLEDAFSILGPDRLASILVRHEDYMGDGAMWMGRIETITTASFRLAFDQHARPGLAELKQSLDIDHCIAAVQSPSVSEPTRKVLKNMLTGLPGFRLESGHHQMQTSRDQHGYATMKALRSISLLETIGDKAAPDLIDGTWDVLVLSWRAPWPNGADERRGRHSKERLTS